MRPLVARVHVPVLHFVNPAALAHDAGHHKYLEAHLAHIETVELPGPDEFWWLDTSGTFYERLDRFIGSP